MKIATFNANSIRSRLDITLDWLQTARPDILCVQETKVVDDLFPAAAFEQAGYHAEFRGQKSYNGVAIISKEAPDEIFAGFEDGGPADEPRLIGARFGNLHVINTYVPQGRDIEHDMYAYKLEWFQRLKKLFSARFSPSDRILWTGDLNVAAEPIDVSHPEKKKKHVCFHEDVRNAFADCCSWGFTDIYRKHHPDKQAFTFYDYRVPHAVENNRGRRIDYLLASAPLAETSNKADIDIKPRLKEKPSDHTFLYADFND